MVTSFHKPAIRDEQGDEAVSQNRLRIPEPVRIGRDSILGVGCDDLGGSGQGSHPECRSGWRPSLLGAKSNLNVYFSNRRGMLHPPSPG